MATKSSSSRKASGGRKYGSKASSKVKRAMHEKKHGTLKSGRSGKKVTSRRQAIAIGLSEARKEGAKVPKKKSSSRRSSSSRSHRSSSRSKSSSRSRSKSHSSRGGSRKKSSSRSR